MVADFEKNAAAYDAICDSWAETRNKSPINRCVVQFAALLEKGCHVLDIGCGTGFPIDAYLSGQGFSVTGIDVSARMLEKARKLNLKNARFLLADAAEYFSDEQFGGVIAFDSLWHLSRNKQLEAYSHIGAMLKRGGYFLFTHGKREGETSGEMFGENFLLRARHVGCHRRFAAQRDGNRSFDGGLPRRNDGTQGAAGRCPKIGVKICFWFFNDVF